MSFITFYPSGDVFRNQPDFLTDLHSPVGIDGFCGRHCETVLGGSFHFRTLPLKLKMDLISIFFPQEKVSPHLHHSQVTCNSGAFLTQMLAFPTLLRSCFPLGTEVETQF